MPSNGAGFLDRLIDRLDRLDPASVQTYVLRLVREKGFFETVFNTIHEGVIVINRRLRIEYCNAASRTLLGLPEDASGQRIDRFLRDVDWDRLMSADPDEWHRISMQEIEVFYPTHRFLNFYLVPHRDAQDEQEMPFATIIVHDVTEAHRDAADTIESEKVQAITMLAAGVAHEIGNPLNSLHIHLQLMDRRLRRLEESDSTRDVRELLAVASDEVDRLDTIINNFLRAVRPTTPSLVPLKITQVLADSLQFMRSEIEGRSILVEATWPDLVPDIMGDADLLKQAFYNVIKNAIQAMPDGGVLRIGCRERGDMLEVSFADTGRGIPAVDLTRIMEPYYTTRSGGTGLGLMIVDRAVRSHGGELGIETAEGQGTVFTIRLPLRSRRVRLLQAPA